MLVKAIQVNRLVVVSRRRDVGDGRGELEERRDKLHDDVKLASVRPDRILRQVLRGRLEHVPGVSRISRDSRISRVSRISRISRDKANLDSLDNFGLLSLKSSTKRNDSAR